MVSDIQGVNTIVGVGVGVVVGDGSGGAVPTPRRRVDCAAAGAHGCRSRRLGARHRHEPGVRRRTRGRNCTGCGTCSRRCWRSCGSTRPSRGRPAGSATADDATRHRPGDRAPGAGARARVPPIGRRARSRPGPDRSAGADRGQPRQRLRRSDRRRRGARQAPPLPRQGVAVEESGVARPLPRARRGAARLSIVGWRSIERQPVGVRGLRTRPGAHGSMVAIFPEGTTGDRAGLDRVRSGAAADRARRVADGTRSGDRPDRSGVREPGRDPQSNGRDVRRTDRGRGARPAISAAEDAPDRAGGARADGGDRRGARVGVARVRVGRRARDPAGGGTDRTRRRDVTGIAGFGDIEVVARRLAAASDAARSERDRPLSQLCHTVDARRARRSSGRTRVRSRGPASCCRPWRSSSPVRCSSRSL